MFGYAEKEKKPPVSVHKPSDRPSVRIPARPALRFDPSELIKSINYRSERQRERVSISISPKITLYGEYIHLPEDWSKGFMDRLMDIIKAAVKKYTIDIKDDSFDVLKNNLIEALKPTSPGDPDKPELLSVLFEQISKTAISLSPNFIEEIKQGCKSYAAELQKYSATNSVKEFLSQWSNFNPDSSMEDINLRNYLYKNIDDVMPLLNIDQVSTTKGSGAEENRGRAARLIRDQFEEKNPTAERPKNPLTEKHLLEILLNLNEIYAPQTIKPYKQGFRYHHAQIGQGDSAIGTTPAMEVEESVTQVINKIVDNLAPCESQLQKGESLPNEMLKTAIATSAMAYQLLISIHPFADGNGRTCRMFANYILMRYGLLPATFSETDAKQSMYVNLEEDNTDESSKLNTPPGAYTAMIKALAASLGELRSQSSSQE